MDASILQLFTTEEVLKRLAKQAATGCLHVFTAKDAANLFFQDGTIVGASKGLADGEDVIKKVLEWKEENLLWHNGQTPPEGLKPMEIQFPAFLASLRLAPKLEFGARKLGDTHPPDTNPITLTVPTQLASTGPMTMSKAKTGTVSLTKPKEMSQSFEDAPPLAPAEISKGNLVPVTSALTATKNMHASSREDDSFEEALMRKHQLALVSVEDPSQRLRIIRSSNLLGRNPACDFTMNHGSISRQHCLLQITERGLHVKDLSTTNGTKVNGIKLTEGYINIGDRLTIGHLDFMLEKDEPPAV